MTFSQRALAAVTAVSMLALCPGAAQALGWGKPATRAVLGETLRMTVPIRLEPGEQVANDCVSAEVFFGDDKVSDKAVLTRVLPTGQGANDLAASHTRSLLVRTTALINEPVVTVLLTAGCQARMTRQFVALADPPTSSRAAADADLPDAWAQARATAREGAGERSTEGAVEGVGALALANTSGQRAAPSAAVPAARKPGRPTGAPRAARAKPEAPLAKAPANRLLLDPAEADALVTPELRASAGMDAALAASAQADGPEVQARRETAAAVWRAMNATAEQQLQSQQRLQDLEKRLVQLHAEGEQTRQGVAALQGRMRELEDDRPSALRAYALGGLALAAVGLALYFYSQLRRQERQHSEWWPPEASGAAPLSVPRDSVQDTASQAEPQDTTTAYIHAAPLKSAAAAAASQARTAFSAAHPITDWGTAPPSFAPAIDQTSAEPLRAVSVEELIDLEQQAEFFTVLGQDAAAIDLLEAHVHGAEGTIPLPFLKLLELYQRLGRRGDYERVQAAFNASFNAHAPTWDADLQQGRSLEEYPGIVERLQALWSAPVRAMDVLEKSLIRPDHEAETFDLPAYRELLFLYAIARDLADKPEGEADAPITAVTPLTATRPFIADPDARPTLSVDLCLDEIGGPTSGAASNVIVSGGLPGVDRAPDQSEGSVG